jgi:hypothetical protein
VSRNLVWLLIVGVIAVGGFFFRDRLEGDAVDLRVGDCFDIPKTLEAVEDVQHHPCNEVHTAEVVGVADYPAGKDEAYPSESMLFAYAEDLCSRTFRDYTGLDPVNDAVMTWGYFYPGSEGWAEGDHEFACYLVRVDEGPMTQSFKRAA